MKKLYRKGTVHPSPPIISDYLSFLPATILTLAAALSPEDKEVLAYLISCNSASSGTTKNNYRNKLQRGSAFLGSNDHGPCFGCDCFRCYMSYWVRWDTSSNRQLIHEIIDAYEDSLVARGKGNGKSKRERKRASKSCTNNSNSSGSSSDHQTQFKLVETDQSAEGSNSGGGGDEEEKGSVRRFVGFIGERIWGAFNLG